MYLTNFTDHGLSNYLANRPGFSRLNVVTYMPVNEYWIGNQLIAIVVFNNETSTRRIYTNSQEFYMDCPKYGSNMQKRSGKYGESKMNFESDESMDSYLEPTTFGVTT